MMELSINCCASLQRPNGCSIIRKYGLAESSNSMVGISGSPGGEYRCRGRPGTTSGWNGGRRGRSSPRSGPCPWSSARTGACHPLCRAALSLQRELPGRGFAPRGAGRGGGPARAGGARPHRPRRHVRGGALFGGRQDARCAHRVRCRAHPGPGGRPLRLPRPLRRAPGGARTRPRGIRPPLQGRLHGAARRFQGGAPGGPGAAGRPARRLLAGPHGLPQGRGAQRAGPARASGRRRLATALAAVRARCSLDELDGWLPAAASAHLRSGYEQAVRLARYPGTVELAAEIGRALAFDLELIAPRLPDFPVPGGHTEMSWLRHLAEQGARRRYGPRGAERVPGAWRQIDHELDMIEQLGYPGYFLIVWDIVQFCEGAGIYCQGRGSAANSAVCYAIGITKADAVSLGLLFERFLSPERDGPPDIDLDIEAGRREEVIQYVYQRYGRERAAQVANVITYRPRSAVRDMGRALGYAPGQLDAWARQLDTWGHGPGGLEGEAADHDVPPAVMELAAQVQGFPRHLGIHSGGMVICDRPVLEVCPVEWATMKDRSVLQWDKDDCAAIGLVKFDLLGLGMLSALHGTVDLIRSHHGVEIDLAELPQEPAVYEMLQAADSIGVFQVESRAQMATLPRLRPRKFYDLVVEVALIRPGPIQGGSVHPYIRRRNGSETVTYLHPLLERSLKKTMGVPLFQEQLMQMAVDVAGFTAAEADQLRQAMGAKRSVERMERLRERLYRGMAERGITGETADRLYGQLAAFANFGFPESHAVSFAYLVYSSAWLKLHYPAAFLAALLNSQPMGFYSPRTLVADARRHGVVVRGPDLHASAATATLEPLGERESSVEGAAAGPDEEGRAAGPGAEGVATGP